MSGAPAMKAAHMKTNVTELRRHPRGDEILERVSLQTLDEIERAPSTAWLPLELDVEISSACVEVLGVDETNAWAQACVVAGLDKPYLRPFFTGLTAVFGAKIRHGLKYALPHSFLGVLKDCGKLTLGVEANNELEIIWSDVPAILLDTHGALDGYAAAMSATFEICQVPGTFETVTRPEDREASIFFRWDE